mmetsp:Transcript_68767/g.128294  ORF Transcript_68767/g.128294 Transcript_68767/m.128294 type:complete len:442 (+) Transcript_68767:119-1444(+)
MRHDLETLCHLRHTDLIEFGELKRERSDPTNSDENSTGAENAQASASGAAGNSLFGRRLEPKRGHVIGAGKLADSSELHHDCRVTVTYSEGETPMAELLRLAGGQGSQVTVEAIAPNSKAAQAGVRTGYALVSLNGHSEFVQLPGWQVRLLLEAPLTVSFEPTDVEPTTHSTGSEICIARPEKIGIPTKTAICGPKDRGVLAEEVVFKPGSASLFLSSESQPPAYHQRMACEDVGRRGNAQVVELRQGDANQLVGLAAQDARKATAQHRQPSSDLCDGQVLASESRNRRTSAATRWRSPVAAFLACAPQCNPQCYEEDAPVDTGITAAVDVHLATDECLSQVQESTGIRIPSSIPQSIIKSYPATTASLEEMGPPGQPYWLEPAWMAPLGKTRNRPEPPMQGKPVSQQQFVKVSVIPGGDAFAVQHGVDAATKFGDVRSFV